MEISNMTTEEIEARMAEIKTEAENEEITEARSVELSDEVDALEERKAEIIAEAEAREAEAKEITEERSGEVIEEHTIEIQEEKRMFGIETKEYRDAFYAMLVGKATEEQRGIFADNTNYGDGVALPVSTDTAIWDQVSTAHPILADVDRVNSGMSIKVTKSTPATIGKKKDSASSSEQTFTNVDVTLAGADYHTYVKLSFAEAKMSVGAMETYLVKEIADAIGEALAADVFARIISDAGTTQKVDKASVTDAFEQVKAALALATQAGEAIVYAPASIYYSLVGAINSNGGTPYNIGTVLGCQIKKDNAATAITVVDPSLFCLNVVQDVSIESAKDLTDATYVIGGYMRAEGCLRKTKAAAYVG